ncbi:DUF3788 domain-containing protein [Anaerosalibacter massiliensis]|uniref:DUF3788 domain-containing protein n=1 Tax=Anaerosalibacter massiliensis TaxID=1347392 RepID=A0A9X2MH84_9FIRM|nr:DUF3788 domain-containing protein [Anaerosalibacter massiliensis]MCR2043998.1 DUF3788 domain-containing protein [Anaerosalibacter massiliensis]
MEWNKLYNSYNPPTIDDINEYINSKLWQDLNAFLQNAYRIQPKLSYSKCSMQPGWNVKYQKNGKSLCTLYPMEGYFIVLLVIGNKEVHQAENIIHLCSRYTQDLYQKTAFSTVGSWLMINVTDRLILDDVINLVQIKAKSK